MPPPPPPRRRVPLRGRYKSQVKDLEKKATKDKKKGKKVAEELERSKLEMKGIEERLNEKWGTAKELLTLKLESYKKDKVLAEITLEKYKTELATSMEHLKAEKLRHDKSKAKFTKLFRQEKVAQESLVKEGSDSEYFRTYFFSCLHLFYAFFSFFDCN